MENLLIHDCRALRAFRGAIILSSAARPNKSCHREESLALYHDQFPP
ncbi:MAG: hypothetical protein M3Y58_11025 [Chloroflexota bacterium]|nr:hypothetical protein [Chloroflexota bacterium]